MHYFRQTRTILMFDIMVRSYPTKAEEGDQSPFVLCPPMVVLSGVYHVVIRHRLLVFVVQLVWWASGPEADAGTSGQDLLPRLVTDQL